MTRVEILCDRCSTPIVADRTKLVAEAGPLRAHRATGGGEAVIDLCRGVRGVAPRVAPPVGREVGGPTGPAHF